MFELVLFHILLNFPGISIFKYCCLQAHSFNISNREFCKKQLTAKNRCLLSQNAPSEMFHRVLNRWVYLFPSKMWEIWNRKSFYICFTLKSCYTNLEKNIKERIFFSQQFLCINKYCVIIMITRFDLVSIFRIFQGNIQHPPSAMELFAKVVNGYKSP